MRHAGLAQTHHPGLSARLSFGQTQALILDSSDAFNHGDNAFHALLGCLGRRTSAVPLGRARQPSHTCAVAWHRLRLGQLVLPIGCGRTSPTPAAIGLGSAGLRLEFGFGQYDPLAQDYARRMWQWLDHLQIQTPICLVGHSLGALMAVSAARLQPQRVRRLVLLAPARGYGEASAEERARVLQSRLHSLQTLGPLGMANARASAMLSPQARPEWIAAVREIMSQIRPAGYTQAVHMLCSGRLLNDVRQLTQPITVASGEADGITTPQACDEVALAAGQRRVSLGPVGHACALEASKAVNELLHLSVNTENLNG